jgi:predicted lysophospholipase L1 biosynthesis ABC-type transport system permease subunit
MHGVWGAVAGAVVGALVVWALAFEHKYDIIPMDLQAAIGSVITGGLSLAGGYLEYSRAERAAAKRADKPKE